MGGSAALDELDFRIVAALQASPRADWQRIGRVVEASASTVARRWARMTEAGLAWMSCHPMRVPGVLPLVGIIEVSCSPARLYAVAEHIVNDPHTMTVSRVTGPCNIKITAVFDGQESLARYVGFRLGNLDGVLAVRSEVATALHTDGSRWRLDRLNDEQLAILNRNRPGRPARTAPRVDPDETDLALMMAMSADCRQSIVELADRTGLSPTTVQRRLSRLEADRILVYRCEVARFLSGSPVGATLLGSVPADGVAAIAAQLSGLREVRLCVSLTGRHNLMFVVWLRSLDDLPALESHLAARIPDLVIADRTITLWLLKVGGHILDPQGRHVRLVPIRAWPDDKAAELETSFLDRLRIG